MARMENSVLDIVVQVGLNEDTGLLPMPFQAESDVAAEDDLYNTAFEPHILAAISADACLFPYSHVCRDENYPPSEPQGDVSVSGGELLSAPDTAQSTSANEATLVRSPPTQTRLSQNTAALNSAPGPVSRLRRTEQKYRLSRRRSCRKVELARKRVRGGKAAESSGGDDTTVRSSELPLSSDVLNSLTSLCFPDGAMCSEEAREAEAHFLVLTDVTGVRSYATCLTYYRPHVVSKAEGERWNVETCVGRNMKNVTYLPSCLVLISKGPYFSLLKDLASRVLEGMAGLRREAEGLVLQQAALQVCRTPAPPAGSHLCLRFVYNDITFSIPAPASHHRSVIDYPLSLLFQHFSAEAVTQIIACLLLQQRIILLSSHYSLLTIIAESVLQLLYPFSWRLTYVPLLSWRLLELVEAPGTYIMGAHRRHTHAVAMVEDVVLVDVDAGTVDTERVAPLPAMPQLPATSFCCQCRLAATNADLMRFNSRARFSYEAAAEAEQRRQQAYNTTVTSAALALHVHLFRGIMPFVKPEKRFFNKEKFLAGLDANDKAFYKAVLETELFNAFLKERMSGRSDEWTMAEEQLQRHNKSSLSTLTSRSVPPRELRKSKSMSTLPLPQSGDVVKTVELPIFRYYEYASYLGQCCELFERIIQESRSAETRAPLHVLVALLSLADGRRLAAVDHLQQLRSCDSRFLQHGLLESVTASLTDDQKKRLLERNILPHSSVHNPAPRPVSVLTHFNKLPRHEMDAREFADRARLLDIAVDEHVISRLFTALLIDKVHLDSVQPEVFEEFYKSWKEAEVALQDVRMRVRQHLHEDEDVLKMSDAIKCSCGTGRIGITHTRLFFMQEGTHNYRLITLLRNVTSVEKTIQKSFFSQLPAVKITFAGQEVFVACVKEQQTLWHAVLREMCAGKQVAEELRDPSILQLAAQNVHIIDAYIACVAEMGILALFSNWEEKLPSLCYYAEQRQSDIHAMTEATRQRLQRRLNPSLGQPSRATVECLLYMPGNKSSGAPGSGREPLLLCGLGNGKLCMYNASTFNSVATLLLANTKKVVSLLCVHAGYVWAACFDAHIYVINVDMRSCHQTLSQHVDAVTDLCHGPSSGLAFSCAVNGEVCEWSTGSSKIVSSFLLPKHKCLTRIVYAQHLLFCCTRDQVVVVTREGHVQHVLSYQDAQPQCTVPVRLDCLLVLPATRQLWVGCGRVGSILVYDLSTCKHLHTITLDAKGISRMTSVGDQVWVGSKDGRVHVLDKNMAGQVRVLHAHRDAIRAMCVALDRYVITGSGSKDGAVMIWLTALAPH